MQKITSKDNSLIKKVVKLNKSAKARKEDGLFITEGSRLCKDALLSCQPFSFFVFSETGAKKFAELFEQASRVCREIYLVPDSVFSFMADTKTPQGVLAAVKILDKKIAFDTIKSNGKFLALENLQDPGNLGTVFRTAEALGLSGIILTEDCCDLYAPKVVRSTMGAVFRLPFMIVDSIGGFLDQHREIESYAAVVHSSCLFAGQTLFPPKCVCVIGNEGSGLTKETIRACRHEITIPMNGRAESLNASAAASILMWEMIR